MAARGELLALIRHAKDDLADVPRRLVLADWLEEHGDAADRARGEVIRGLAIGKPVDGLSRQRDHGRAWYGPLRAVGPVMLDHRGFTAWSPQGRSSIDAEAAALGEPLAWLSSLTVTGVSGTAVGRLIGSGLLHEAETLLFRGSGVGTEGVAHLSRLPAAAALRHLHLGYNRVEHAGVKRLSQAAFAPRLRSLDLSNNPLRAESLSELAAAPLTSLRELWVGSAGLYDGGANLARAPWLPTLRRLYASESDLLDGGTARLLREGDLSSLVTLDLSGNRLAAQSVAALADSTTLTALEELDLGGNSQLGGAVAALAEWPGLRRLRRLSLAGVRHTLDGLEALAASPYLDRLEALDLLYCAPFEAAVRALRDRFGDRLLV